MRAWSRLGPAAALPLTADRSWRDPYFVPHLSCLPRH